MRIDDQQRGRTEARIRAAMDRLLGGELPRGGKCDVKTLAAEAGLSRAALYSTYTHLKDEFEQRRTRLRDAGTITDPRQSQIEKLKEKVATLRDRVTEREDTIAELTRFRATALSRLAAQHEEIERLRAHVADHSNVRALRRVPNQPEETHR
jgi:chromosome segregation ATPase